LNTCVLLRGESIDVTTNIFDEFSFTKGLAKVKLGSRILVMVYFSINSISYQYMSMPDLSYGKNINNDTWNLPGEVL
jgi:hypothetical protein